MPSNISNYHSARQALLKDVARNETIDNKSNKKTNIVANRILAERPRIELLSKQKLRSEEIKEDCSPSTYVDEICDPDVYRDRHNYWVPTMDMRI